MTRRLRMWFTAALTGLTLGLLIPARAWAADNGVDRLVVEAARTSRRGGFGVFGLVCCLAVIAIVVVVVLLISRNRRRR